MRFKVEHFYHFFATSLIECPYRGSYECSHIIEFRNSNKMQGFAEHIYRFMATSLTNCTNVRFYLSYDYKTTLKSCFGVKTSMVCHYVTKCQKCVSKVILISYDKYKLTNIHVLISFIEIILSYDVASGSEIMPCNKIDKPLVVIDFRETL